MIIDGISSADYSPMHEADPWDLDQLLSGEQVRYQSKKIMSNATAPHRSLLLAAE